MKWTGPVGDIASIIFMIARYPVYGGIMITNEVKESTGFLQIAKCNDITRQYKNIAHRPQWVLGKKFLIFRKFQVEIRTELYFHH